MLSKLTLGSRRSKLALWQTHHVRDLLAAAWPELEIVIKTMTTQGDRVLDKPLPEIGGKGLFTEELEAALRARSVDVAVHSLKDLPTESPEALTIGAVPPRVDPSDALVSRGGHTLASLPQGAVVGSSSRRRAAQLLRARPDLQLIDIRGNVPTRVEKALDPAGPYDAILLAYAGLTRLGMADAVSEIISEDLMLPAPGQGALGIQCRDEAESLAVLAPLDDPESRAAVEAERTFLQALGGGCSVPIAASGRLIEGRLHLIARVLTEDGTQQIEVWGEGPPSDPKALGQKLADEALAQGARELLQICED